MYYVAAVIGFIVLAGVFAYGLINLLPSSDWDDEDDSGNAGV